MKSVLALFLAILSLRGQSTSRAPGAPPVPFDPTVEYTVQYLEGWDIMVNQRLAAKEHRDLRDRALKLLSDHLYRITRVVPPGPLANLRRIPVWVELNEPHHPCMCYHPDAAWLRRHDMNPQKAGAIEIANAENFLKWTQQQPWMVLHELAHGYHHQVLGFDHADVKSCFRYAVASGVYRSVLHWDGRKKRAYALENDMEYFAESTEAYFGSNDFYPFVRAELKQHDPRMYDLIEKAWGVKPWSANDTPKDHERNMKKRSIKNPAK
jgi:hypothetical protein